MNSRDMNFSRFFSTSHPVLFHPPSSPSYALHRSPKLCQGSRKEGCHSYRQSQSTQSILPVFSHVIFLAPNRLLAHFHENTRLPRQQHLKYLLSLNLALLVLPLVVISRKLAACWVSAHPKFTRMWRSLNISLTYSYWWWYRPCLWSTQCPR